MIAVVSTMMAASSVALPPGGPLHNHFNASHTFKPGDFTIRAPQDDIPECALPCIRAAIRKATKCDGTDLTCACKSAHRVSVAGRTCVVKACGFKTVKSMCHLSSSSSSSSRSATSAAATTSSFYSFTLPFDWMTLLTYMLF
jgi:hypothetical protein